MDTAIALTAILLFAFLATAPAVAAEPADDGGDAAGDEAHFACLMTGIHRPGALGMGTGEIIVCFP